MAENQASDARIELNSPTTQSCQFNLRLILPFPPRSGMENIVRGNQSQGRFAVAFEEVADDRIANIPYQRVKSKFLSLIFIYDAADISCQLLLSKLNDPGEITRCETT